MTMKILVTLVLLCLFTLSFGFSANAIIQQTTLTNDANDVIVIQGPLVEPNSGGGGDPVPGPGVPS